MEKLLLREYSFRFSNLDLQGSLGKTRLYESDRQFSILKGAMHEW